MGFAVSALLVLVVAAGVWLGFLAGQIRDNLQAATALLPELKSELLAADGESAETTVKALQGHVDTACRAATNPVWRAASAVPWLGPNFAAVSDVSASANDLVRLAAVPMVGALEGLDVKALSPVDGAIDLGPLQRVTPSIVSAARAVELSHDRLAGVDTDALLPSVGSPLRQATDELENLRRPLSAAADAAQLLPAMMGGDGPRNYLLLIQNSAEVRATGGIPGALAVLRANEGRLDLVAQGSATGLGVFDPPVSVDPVQTAIYTDRIGKFMQDVNLTPNFPTAAAAAREMWESRYPDQQLDGVLSVDPVALASLLKVTGPIDIGDMLSAGFSSMGLPSKLNSANLVDTLLSGVYTQIQDPTMQDAYFAVVAKRVFDAVSNTPASAGELAKVLNGAVTDGRLLLWSTHQNEQKLLEGRTIGGAISGVSVPAAGFGVYFNDGTQAKMDYYVRRTVQLVQRCSTDGYAQYTARIIMTNTAPRDAGVRLPAYVTGSGSSVVVPGNVVTNVVAYGPTQAQVQEARVDGATVGLSSHTDADRPVGSVRLELVPGQTRTLDVDFSNVVQTSQAQLKVTPTIQKTPDVVLPTKVARCD